MPPAYCRSGSPQTLLQRSRPFSGLRCIGIARSHTTHKRSGGKGSIEPDHTKARGVFTRHSNAFVLGRTDCMLWMALRTPLRKCRPLDPPSLPQIPRCSIETTLPCDRTMPLNSLSNWPFLASTGAGDGQIEQAHLLAPDIPCIDKASLLQKCRDFRLDREINTGKGRCGQKRS